tara:strand:- start:12849 stop:13472 length:624 start_codon:yes stop_codon:yes gene_type:complete
MESIIIGAGGFAKEVLGFLQEKNKTIKGFISNEEGDIEGIPILGNDKILPELIKQEKLEAYITIGKPSLRKKLLDYVISLGYETPNLIHKTSYISQKSNLGVGCIIYPGVVVNAYVEIGNGVLLNSNSSVGHETIIKDCVNINPNVSIAGKVKIGKCCYIGIGASIIEDLTIGQESIIGAGAVVINSIPECVTAVGVPAKIIKKNKE